MLVLLLQTTGRWATDLKTFCGCNKNILHEKWVSFYIYQYKIFKKNMTPSKRCFFLYLSLKNSSILSPFNAFWIHTKGVTNVFCSFVLLLLSIVKCYGQSQNYQLVRCQKTAIFLYFTFLIVSFIHYNTAVFRKCSKVQFIFHNIKLTFGIDS